MIDLPTYFTSSEGSTWRRIPKTTRISNSDLLCCKNKRGHLFKDDRLGYRRIHSLKWEDGSRWDSINGMTKGTLPR